MPWRRSARVITLAATALLVATTGVPAASPAGGEKVIHASPPGVISRVRDLSTNGLDVAVAWDETGPGARGGLTTSDDGGGLFFDWVASAEDASGRGDACDRPLQHVAVTGFTNGDGDRGLHLWSGVVTRTLEEAGTDFLRADVACIGARQVVLVVAWRRPGGTRLILWRFQPDLTDGPRGFDLGPVNATSAPVVVARGSWLHVAWLNGRSLRYKRFRIGSGDTPSLAAKPTQTIETTRGQAAPQLGASGKRVILAWQRKGSIVARVSTDAGAGFGRRRTLIPGDPATGKVAVLTSADVRGRLMVVAGAVVSEGITAAGGLALSEDSGRSWSMERSSAWRGGFLYAALAGDVSTPHVALAVDQRYLSADPHSILFSLLAR